MCGATPVQHLVKLFASKPIPRGLAAYGHTWSAQQLVPFVNVVLGITDGAVDNRMLSALDWGIRLPLAAFTAFCPSLPALIFGHIASLVLFLVHMPFVWDHMGWSAIMEVSFVVVMLRASQRTATKEMSTIVDHFFSIARFQMILLYFSAAFWKLTTSFLDPRTSCGTILTGELLGYLMPGEVIKIAPESMRLLLISAPLLTVLGEFAISALLGLWPGLGVLLGLLFHFSICLLPVNYAGGFSIACSARYVVFLPEAVAAVFEDQGCRRAWLGTTVLASAVAVAVAKGSVDANFVLYVYFTLLYMLALLKQARGKTAQGAREAMASRTVPCAIMAATMCFGLLGPIVGLQNMGSLTMYGNVKHYGGSNHLIVPTGLLQGYCRDSLFSDGAQDTWLCDASGGWVVRVDATNSAALQRLSPADASDLLPANARTLLKAAGSSGKYFAMYYSRMTSSDFLSNLSASLGGMPAQTPYVVSLFELRRLLALARRRGEPFWLRFTPLPESVRSLGLWRTHAATEVLLDEDPRSGLMTCSLVNGSSSTPCNDGVLARLGPPPWWLSKVLLPYPVPLLDGADDEVHCSA
mmetsp:Transcript_121792/g.355891  ORF Transcript_121792/g.355891 Transcript_121792/m.355891 type:complete len:581 (-) Transcript_121792:7-1749(-)